MQLGDVSGALVLSILQLVVVGVLILLTTQFDIKKSAELSQMVFSRIRKPQTSGQIIFITLVALISAIIVIMPLVSVVSRSIFIGQKVNFSIWQSIFTDKEIFKSLTTSLKYAVFTIVVSTTIGLFGACAVIYGSARYRFLNLLTALPVVVSAVTLGLGLIITFDVNPIDWRGAWLMMPIAHCLVAIPIVMRIISPTIRDLPNGLRDASQTLGATTWQMWRTIDLRLIKPALVSAAAIACAVSLGEFGASSFLVRRNNETLPLMISRLLGRPGEIIQAQAYAIATLLIVACVVIIGVVDHLGTEKHR
jgi:thiamine transport system permease protein